MVAAIRAVVAYQRAVAQQQQVRVRVEQGAARVAAEAVNVPSVAGCAVLASACSCQGGIGPWRRSASEGARDAMSQREMHTKFKGLAFLEDLDCISTCTAIGIAYLLPRRSPCTDTRHRPGPAGTLGTLQASPYCVAAVVCGYVEGVSKVTPLRVLQG